MPVIGTPEQVADRFEEMYEAGEGDGFMLVTHTLPESVTEFVEMVVAAVLPARTAPTGAAAAPIVAGPQRARIGEGGASG